MYNEKETEIIIKELGSRIKKARELKKWYQEDLAERVGLSRNTILNYEKGSRKIRSEVQKPFAIKTEGDSMEGAGVLEGSIAIINPAEEVRSGEIALVCVDDSWLIKWVVYKPNGDIELCPANPNYQTIIVDKEYATDPSWFRIIGKVVKTITENKLRNAF